MREACRNPPWLYGDRDRSYWAETVAYLEVFKLSLLATFWQRFGNGWATFWQRIGNVLATFGYFWQLLATFGSFWKLLETFGYFWQLLATLKKLIALHKTFLYLNMS